jgi:hypothetical protein
MNNPEFHAVLVLGSSGLPWRWSSNIVSTQTVVVVVASYLPGDRSKHYALPWAGAKWMPMSAEDGCEEERDAVTYGKFAHFASQDAHVSGVMRIDIRSVFAHPNRRSACTILVLVKSGYKI